MMNEHEFTEALMASLEEDEFAEELLDVAEFDGSVRVCTFAEAGLLTSNVGLVVRVGGQEFQLTVVRSQ